MHHHFLYIFLGGYHDVCIEHYITHDCAVSMHILPETTSQVVEDFIRNVPASSIQKVMEYNRIPAIKAFSMVLNKSVEKRGLSMSTPNIQDFRTSNSGEWVDCVMKRKLIG